MKDHLNSLPQGFHNWKDLPDFYEELPYYIQNGIRYTLNPITREWQEEL